MHIETCDRAFQIPAIKVAPEMAASPSLAPPISEEVAYSGSLGQLCHFFWVAVAIMFSSTAFAHSSYQTSMMDAGI